MSLISVEVRLGVLETAVKELSAQVGMITKTLLAAGAHADGPTRVEPVRCDHSHLRLVAGDDHE